MYFKLGQNSLIKEYYKLGVLKYVNTILFFHKGIKM